MSSTAAQPKSLNDWLGGQGGIFGLDGMAASRNPSFSRAWSVACDWMANDGKGWGAAYSVPLRLSTSHIDTATLGLSGSDKAVRGFDRL